MLLEKFRLVEHCSAIKRYLLLGQGDFVQCLMDAVGPELDASPARVSAFKLVGTLESAVRASNAQYDDADMLERLRVRMMPHAAGEARALPAAHPTPTRAPPCRRARGAAAAVQRPSHRLIRPGHRPRHIHEPPALDSAVCGGGCVRVR